jgi:elongation factor P
MKTAFQSRLWTVLRIDNQLYLVVKFEYRRGGRGATTINLRLKNLLEGNTLDRQFDGEDKMEDIMLDRAKFEFLYESEWNFFFMDNESFEQIELWEDSIWDNKFFLTEGIIVDVQQYEGKFIWISLPTSVRLTIAECDPWVKGNTADGKVMKDAVTHTWLSLKIPGFVEQGEDIMINTESWEYSERAK